MKNVALVLSGGIGSRFGAEAPKQYVEVCGKPILVHTLQRIERIDEISDIWVVCAKEWSDTVRQYGALWRISKLRGTFPGGQDGWESISHGIDGLQPFMDPEDIVVIQDGNRCNTSPNIFLDGLRVCREQGMAIACVKQYNECFVEDTAQHLIDRDHSYVLHRPEFFRWEKLLRVRRMHDAAPERFRTFSPSTMMIENGERISVSMSNMQNIKITYQEELDLVEALLKKSLL